MLRNKNLNEILSLDPMKDHHRILFITSELEFPIDHLRALEFALFRTYAIPSISALLAQTGEFAKHGQKRYDDTSLIMAEIVEQGYDSERGHEAIRRMNNIHRHFPISNEDKLYVLSTFIFEPIRWNKMLGWRLYTEHERQATFYFWREVGKRMNIQDIPESFEDYERFNHDYEAKYYTYTDTNRHIADATVDIFCRWYPAVFSPLVKIGIYALLDEPLRKAFGFPAQPAWLRWTLERVMRLRAFAIQFLPVRRRPFLFTKQKNRTYPRGYQIETLGPTETT
ncbi:MAG: DUF2236 domain-containing protein [Anaerolineae bacterium]|nr:DUF2236 domain-containing protein [Anaerolineae bacterium]